MESWSFNFSGKGLVLDDSVSETGVTQEISKNGLMGSELKSPWSYGCNSMESNQVGDQIQEFLDLGSSYDMKKSSPISFVGKSSDFACEDDSSSMFSTSVVESNARDSSLIDLKLGRISDSKAKTNFSSSESSVPMKRARAGGLGSQTPYCQVQGCRKDLSSCKDYHKRHKVCEIHSKTTKVIVNGIEKRFCQQCSRFHLLAEFDDGKRSCRKRLAGHNERRRKPHIHIHAGRAGRLFQSSNGKIQLIQDIADSSFVSRTLFPSYPLGNEDMTVLDSSSTNGGLSDALSLLSSQSQCSSVSTLVSSGNRSLYALRQPENLSGISSQAPTTFSSSLLGSGEDNGGADTIEIDRFLQQSAYMSSKNQLPFQLDPTMNLLQLSTQLQDVEHQRQSSMMKHDNHDFSSFGNAQ